MKYIVETSANDREISYSEAFDTFEEAVDEMRYQWERLSGSEQYELMRRDYLDEWGYSSYMSVLGGLTETINEYGLIDLEIKERYALAEMIEDEEEEEEDE